MGFFDFLKRKKQPQIEKIKFIELEELIKNKQEKIQNQITIQINTKIYELIQELNTKVDNLEKINLQKIKTEEKIRLIIKKNLENYIIYLKRLIANLENIQEKEPNNLIQKINSIFSEFEQKSNISYQKATFLIGRELGEIKHTIAVFFKDIEKILKQKKELLKTSKIINSIQLKLKETNQIEKIKQKIKNNIKELEQNFEQLKNKENLLQEKIQEIKQSDKYKEQQDSKEKIQEIKQELNENLNNLKHELDFKSLANKFHSDEKNMSLIKQYKENIKQALEKDPKLKILELLEKENKKSIENKINRIQEQKQQINKIQEQLNKDELENTSIEIQKIKKNLEDSKYYTFLEKKKLEKFNKNKQQIIYQIKQELAEINVEIED